MNIRKFKVGFVPEFIDIPDDNYDKVVIDYGNNIHYYGQQDGCNLLSLDEYRFVVEGTYEVTTSNERIRQIEVLNIKPNYTLSLLLLFDTDRETLETLLTTPTGDDAEKVILKHLSDFDTYVIDTRHDAIQFKKQYKLKEFFRYATDSESTL